jgi:cob(I)alamin adenosyltransferase
MGHRLSKIVTRTGDAGTTGLGDGSRVAKDSLRIDAIGEIDELNSMIGVVLSEQLPPRVHDLLVGVQHDLFDLGGELAVPGGEFLKAGKVEALEAVLALFNGELAPLAEFILPGGTRAAALAHLARSVCRRAERAVVALNGTETVSATCRQYLNRLSDLLFVLGRWLNKHAGEGDVLWQKNRKAD